MPVIGSDRKALMLDVIIQFEPVGHIFEVEGHQGLLLVLLQPLEGARRNSHTIIKPILLLFERRV
jgi:hypothetical protein